MIGCAFVGDLDIGVILGQRQDRLGEQRDAVPRVAARIVAVGGLGAIDVPVGGGVARVARLDHRLQRGTDDGAAGLAAVEEFLLVDFGGFVGVADEDDVDPLVFALEEEVQEDEEALGEILLALAHRGRDVHQAEHHRLGARNDRRREAVVAHVDRIDERNGALPPPEALDLGVELADPQLVGDFQGRPWRASASSSASSRSTSAMVGRRSARRRLMLTRIVRSTARFGVAPSLE